MKKLSELIAEAERVIQKEYIETISFDIDGTLYPMRKVEFRWWLSFVKNPFKALKFLVIRKKWEGRRNGRKICAVTENDVSFFETFLAKELLYEGLVPAEIKEWILKLNDRGKKIYFLSDHGAEVKADVLKLPEGKTINCLTEAGELKPHSNICQILRKHQILPATHLHLGDRWTDEEQAKLFNCKFFYFIHQ